MNRIRVLVVDDEPQIQRFLKPALTAAGYEVIRAADGATALQRAGELAPDIIVLDLGLPDMDGKEVLIAVRSRSQVPVIILSARDRETEKIEALDLGADDYVEKPFAIGELMARLRTALRHVAQKDHAVTRVEMQGLVVDTMKRSVTKHGTAVKLTPKEYDLLVMLVRHAGRVVTHRQILTQVWGPAHTDDTQYLRVFVGQLRAKIGDDANALRFILTEPGVGYRFADPDG